MNAFLSNWTFFRLLRLVLGIMMLIQAIMLKDVLLGIAAVVFSIMALSNIGCCGVNACCDSPKTTPKDSSKEIIYEEVVESK